MVGEMGRSPSLQGKWPETARLERVVGCQDKPVLMKASLGLFQQCQSLQEFGFPQRSWGSPGVRLDLDGSTLPPALCILAVNRGHGLL